MLPCRIFSLWYTHFDNCVREDRSPRRSASSEGRFAWEGSVAWEGRVASEGRAASEGVFALEGRVGEQENACSAIRPVVTFLKSFSLRFKDTTINMSRKDFEAVNYYSKDFDWDELRQEVENNPSFQFHLLPHSKLGDRIHNAQQDSEAWNKFHARHSTGKFFKERRYLLKEFPELASCIDNSKVLEVGCGNGSTALPILCGRERIDLYACDSSNEALDRTKEIIDDANSISAKHRFHPFLCDFSTDGFPSWFASIGGVDFVTLIFTLSALPLDRMPKAITECFNVLKPGGLLLFRDYGLYDMTMLRFEPEQKKGYREYLRSDGTRSYFFCLDTVRSLISAAGFIEVELEYCCVNSVNRRKGKVMKRVWVHGKFQKPAACT